MTYFRNSHCAGVFLLLVLTAHTYREHNSQAVVRTEISYSMMPSVGHSCKHTTDVSLENRPPTLLPLVDKNTNKTNLSLNHFVFYCFHFQTALCGLKERKKTDAINWDFPFHLHHCKTPSNAYFHSFGTIKRSGISIYVYKRQPS